MAKGLGDQIGSGLSQGLSHGKDAVGTLGDYLRQQRQASRLSLRQLADAAGVSNPYLSQIERGLRKPSAEILQQIAKGLRISAETLYVRAGILDERVGDAEVAAAILGDSVLTERQKNVLLDIYESFRRENAAAAVDSGAAAPVAAEVGDDAGSSTDDSGTEDSSTEDSSGAIGTTATTAAPATRRAKKSRPKENP